MSQSPLTTGLFNISNQITPEKFVFLHGLNKFEILIASITDLYHFNQLTFGIINP